MGDIILPRDMDNSNAAGVYGSGKSWASDASVLVPGAPRNIEPVKRSFQAIDKFSEDILEGHNQLREDHDELREEHDVIAPFVVPTGSLMPFAGIDEPDGWVFCDGSEYSAIAEEFEPLYNVIGITYGGTAGVVFRVPDMRGNLALGRDNMGGSTRGRVTSASLDGGNAILLGKEGGSQTQALTAAQLPSHRHKTMHPLGTHQIRQGSGNTVGNHFWNATDSFSNQYFWSDYQGSGNAHNNMPPYMTLNYIIKL